MSATGAQERITQAATAREGASVHPLPAAGKNLPSLFRAIYGGAVRALRKIYPPLLNLEQYLRKNGWGNAQPIPIPENPGWGR